jgi:hypothetical protein
MKKTQLQIFTDALDKLKLDYDEHTFPVGDDELLVVITTPQIIVRSCASCGVPRRLTLRSAKTSNSVQVLFIKVFQILR